MVQAAARPVVVTGVVVVHNGAAWLKECLDALALQTRPLDRLVIVDTGSTDDSLRIAQGHARIRQVVSNVAMISAPAKSTFGEAVALAVEQTTPEPVVSERVAAERMNFEQMMSSEQMTPERVAAEQMRSEQASSESALPDAAAGWLWLLHDDSAAAPQALVHLLDAVRRSPSVGVAGPKLVTWQDPSRLLEVGPVITRSGRRVGGPARASLIRVNTTTAAMSWVSAPRECSSVAMSSKSSAASTPRSGSSVMTLTSAGGRSSPVTGSSSHPGPACVRLRHRRTVNVPRAFRRSTRLDRRDRRHGRQVALARCSLYAAPFLAIWIALASLGSAAALLVAKRPRGARAALGDFASLMTPWRPAGSALALSRQAQGPTPRPSGAVRLAQGRIRHHSRLTA